MSLPRKKFWFAAVAVVTMWAFMQSPPAQNSGSGEDSTSKSTLRTGAPLEMGVPVTAVSAAADRKAAAAMANESNLIPPTDAYRKAVAAMTNESNLIPPTAADRKAAEAMTVEPNSTPIKK